MTDETTIDSSAVRAVEETVYIYTHVADKLHERSSEGKEKIDRELILSVFGEAMSFHRVLNTKRSYGSGGTKKQKYSNALEYLVAIYEKNPTNPEWKNIYSIENSLEEWDWDADKSKKSIIEAGIYTLLAQLLKDGYLIEKAGAAPTTKGQPMTGYKLTESGYEKYKSGEVSGSKPKPEICINCTVEKWCTDGTEPGSQACSDTIKNYAGKEDTNLIRK